MTLLVLCDICQEDLPLERFLFYNCGHGYCDTCTPAITQRTCPMCRKKRDHEPHRVYLTPAATTVEEKAKALGRALNSVGPESSEQATRRIGKKIHDFAKEAKVDEITASKLLGVAKNMDERIAPLFFQLRLEQDEKRALQDKVNLWLPRVNKTESVERQVACLKEHLQEQKKALTEAEMEKAKLAGWISAQTQEIESLKDTMSQQLGVISLKNAEIAQLKKIAEDEARHAGLYKKKLKLLSKGQPRHKKDLDDSLIVRPPNPLVDARNREHCL
ncbi:hypothetical protein VKT23_018043 [Stygiomarasmius scandens]|uniref:RING-type domain-containing protein n=1 Tax=Marasmiellus scandens TaxID=2682957 RepID=A0ABR1IQA4_9AGAR